MALRDGHIVFLQVRVEVLVQAIERREVLVLSCSVQNGPQVRLARSDARNAACDVGIPVCPCAA